MIVTESGVLRPSQRDVLGHGVIELFDARSGRCVHKQDFENFIAIPWLEHNKWMVRKDYSESFPFHVGSDFGVDTTPSYLNGPAPADPEVLFPGYHLVTTDSTAAEDPATETYMPGQIIAWANKHPYSGADTKRGTINLTEATSTITSSRWVFDWPTNSGNGTFRSIGWTWLNESKILQFASITGDQFCSEATRDYKVLRAGTGSPVSPNFQAAYDSGGDKLYIDGFDGGGNIWVVPWSTGQYPSAAQFRMDDLPGGFAICNGYLYMCSYGFSSNARVKAFPLNSTGFPTTPTYDFIPTAWATSGLGFEGIASDGTNLWIADQRGTVYKINDTTGATISSFAVPTWTGANVYGMAYDPGTGDLFIQASNSVIFRVSTSGTLRYAAYNQFAGPLVPKGTAIYNPNGSYSWGSIDPLGGGLGTRTKLGASVTKSASETMKITYEFDYS